ncbi:hypothetical protein [Streptomyces sp. NRRL WC-3742]|uniref:hypothetical protein n=1 Tax=Streptomyces sp. NRRL WC-3742 TaxID=1463934 RepID=UPI0004C9222C|nr:hypothetical protein [Streptomyces sp. NRRL WC-3742]
MAFFGLFGNDRQMAGGTYAGRESATDRKQRKQVERERRDRIRRSKAATAADRAGWAWADAERRRQG